MNSITSNLKKENTISLSSTEFNKWINVQIILANRTSQVDFALDFKNDGDSSIFGDETVNIYIDNIHVLQTNENDTKVNESILLSFEEEVEMLNVHEFNKSSYEWVSYTAENITPYTSEESHALKVQASESNEYYPGAIIDLGQTYSKGTQLTFMTYLKNAQSSNDDVYIETYARDSLNNGRQSNTTVMSSKKYNDWILVTVTLSKDTSFLEIFVNLSGKISDAKNVQFYVDRIQVLKSNADVNFEEVTDSFRVEGNGGTPVKRVACKDISITPQEDMGNYVLEMDGTKKTYPGVIIDLGKTLAQGTVITMKTYTAVDSSVINGRTINFECFSVDNTRESNTCTYSTNNYNEWITVTVTLKQDTKKIQLFTNLDAGQGNAAFGENTVKIYLDNVSIVDTKGDMTFENASDIQRVEGNGDTTVKRVAYKDIDIKPQSNMGDYVLEIDGTGQAWPGMFINFGETLKKGSKVTMKMYAAVDADIVCHSVKSVLKVECFTIFSNDNREGNSVALSSSKYNQWITVTVTLNHDTDRIHLFANTDCFNNGKSALGSKVLKVYLDNVHIGE